jgi:EpsI family protein
MKKQFWLIAFILVVAIIYLKVFATIEAVPLPADIGNFSKQVGSFSMTGSSEFSEEIVQELGVDSYINRDYRDNDGYQLSLYLGYYEEQREGSMIHSPKNCMPGSGWNPVESSVIPIRVSDSNKTYKVNRMLFQKGMDKLVMHYWYQGRNRIVANEYIDRFFLILDSIFRHRSEGALVRVIGPWDPSGKNEQKQEQFVANLFPVLQQHLPQ